MGNWQIGVSATKNAVFIAQATGSIPFQARSIIFARGGKRRHSTIALLASSSGRFKSSVEAIKAEAITELAAADSGLPQELVERRGGRHGRSP